MILYEKLRSLVSPNESANYTVDQIYDMICKEEDRRGALKFMSMRNVLISALFMLNKYTTLVKYRIGESKNWIELSKFYKYENDKNMLL